MNITFVPLGFEKFAVGEAQGVVDESIVLLESLARCGTIQLNTVRKVVFQDCDYQEVESILAIDVPDVLIIQFATLAMGDKALKLVESLPLASIILWGIREPIPFTGSIKFNSFTSLNMLSSFMHRSKRRFLPLYGNPSERATKATLEGYIGGCKIKHGLSVAKFCAIGSAPPGFYLSDMDTEVFQSWSGGCETVRISTAELVAMVDEKVAKHPLLESSKGSYAALKVDAKEEHRALGVQMQNVLEEYACDNSIAGFAIQCWPDLTMLKGFAPCGVVSMLNDRGIPVSCETDIPSLISMFIAGSASAGLCDDRGSVVFLTDMVNIRTTGEIDLWHCGCGSPSLVSLDHEPQYGEHPTMKCGIGISANFPLKGGSSLLLKFSEMPSGYQVFAIRGTSATPEVPMRGSHVEFVPDVASLQQILEGIFEFGIEHHYALAYAGGESDLGIMVAKVEAYAAIAGAKLILY